jgi:hypothetical protein
MVEHIRKLLGGGVAMALHAGAFEAEAAAAALNWISGNRSWILGWFLSPTEMRWKLRRGMAEAIATLQEAVRKAALEAAKEEVVDEAAGDSEALAEAEVETIVREAEAAMQGELSWLTLCNTIL